MLSAVGCQVNAVIISVVNTKWRLFLCFMLASSKPNKIFWANFEPIFKHKKLLWTLPNLFVIFWHCTIPFFLFTLKLIINYFHATEMTTLNISNALSLSSPLECCRRMRRELWPAGGTSWRWSASRGGRWQSSAPASPTSSRTRTPSWRRATLRGKTGSSRSRRFFRTLKR